MAHWEAFQHANRIRAINVTAQIILSISFVLGLNYLAFEHYIRTDVTQGRINSLSPESQFFVEQIDPEEPVKIIVTLARDGDEVDAMVYDMVGDLLEEYENAGRASGGQRIVLEYVDIYRDRARTQELKNIYSLDQANLVIVTSGNQQQLLLPGDLLEVEGGEVIAFKGEQAITSAIAEVSTKDQKKIYFTVGHGEMRIDDVDTARGLSETMGQLRLRNYGTAVINIAEKEIPGDADLVIIAGPRARFQRHEVEKLRQFLANSGRVMILLPVAVDAGLEDLLYEYGIRADDMLVVDRERQNRETGGSLVVRSFIEHAITQELTKKNLPVFLSLARPVREDRTAPYDESLEITGFLFASSSNAWADRAYRRSEFASLEFDERVDLPGPVSIAAMSERRARNDIGIEIEGGKLLVVGNDDFISNSMVTVGGNQWMFFSMISYLLDEDAKLRLPPRPFEKVQLALTQNELIYIGLGLGAIPVAIGFLGFFISLLRRQ